MKTKDKKPKKQAIAIVLRMYVFFIPKNFPLATNKLYQNIYILNLPIDIFD